MVVRVTKLLETYKNLLIRVAEEETDPEIDCNLNMDCHTF